MCLLHCFGHWKAYQQCGALQICLPEQRSCQGAVGHAIWQQHAGLEILEKSSRSPSSLLVTVTTCLLLSIRPDSAEQYDVLLSALVAIYRLDLQLVATSTCSCSTFHAYIGTYHFPLFEGQKELPDVLPVYRLPMTQPPCTRVQGV
eukprot:GHUV01037568.1.p1 GENE.GHUV01037568.1~~GHUV01037568.1.p1  ORF type:complete len:146 (+),score=24.28 GHUV01037568.1:545-982(+)